MKKSPENQVVSAFTEDQVERLTGISKRQLQYWDRQGFFAPSLAYEDRRVAYSRLYSFRDIVSLKVLNALRNEAHVPLAHLREVKDKLAHLGDDVWAKTTLYVLNRKVVLDNEEVVSGQGVLQIPLQVVAGDMRKAVAELNQRDTSQVGQLSRKRGLVRNQTVIAGTRIPVRSIKAFAHAGYSTEEIIREYPSLTADDVRAAIAYDEAA